MKIVRLLSKPMGKIFLNLCPSGEHQWKSFEIVNRDLTFFSQRGMFIGDDPPTIPFFDTKLQ